MYTMKDDTFLVLKALARSIDFLLQEGGETGKEDAMVLSGHMSQLLEGTDWNSETDSE